MSQGYVRPVLRTTGGKDIIAEFLDDAKGKSGMDLVMAVWDVIVNAVILVEEFIKGPQAGEQKHQAVKNVWIYIDNHLGLSKQITDNIIGKAYRILSKIPFIKLPSPEEVIGSLIDKVVIKAVVIALNKTIWRVS